MGFDKYMQDVQDMSRIGQMINKDLIQKENELQETYYRRVLECRFNTIKDKLLAELHYLSER